jgi:uncharacterized protein
MRLIGIEEHYLTADVRDAWEAIGLAATDPSVALRSGEVERRLLDLVDKRLALMDETGLDVQVLSLTAPALHDLGEEMVELARRANDAVAEAIARWPDRLQALATLPISMPDEAALELERCVRTLGFKGTMLCGRVNDRNLDHSDFFPTFKSAEALNVPVLLHPRTPAPAVRSAYYSGFAPEVDAAFAMYGLGWHYDAGIQFIRLMLAGTFDRLPGLQVILGHWGEVVLFYAERTLGGVGPGVEIGAADRDLPAPQPLRHGQRYVPAPLSRESGRDRRDGSAALLYRLPLPVPPGWGYTAISGGMRAG